MTEKPTMTFRLGEDFYDKLDGLTKKILDDGFQLFEDEFKNIDAFYDRAVNDLSKRDDHIFRRSPKSFYLIEALYYQIFEYANREAFNKAEETVIILPQCLSLMQEKCKRKRKRYGHICTRCVPNCSVNRIMQIADKYEVEAYFSKGNIEKQLRKIRKHKPSLAVIGISCILTLASGMRSAREVGVPSRGVFLNFTGCEHWSDKPFSTETAVHRVKTILEEKYEIPHSQS